MEGLKSKLIKQKPLLLVYEQDFCFRFSPLPISALNDSLIKSNPSEHLDIEPCDQVSDRK